MSRTRAVITVVATCAVITVAYFATIPILYASDGLFGGPISSPVMAIPMSWFPTCSAESRSDCWRHDTRGNRP